ncbi:uncharacterized protein [Nicotiana tomentosiformis]|uniref:uncharacterized protein n=1 Tax=Nicotiana tomentosiformis TaxID=4098 RepID=UPI00388CC419
MLEAREEVENEILWEMNWGSTNVWHENWTGLGALYHIVPNDYTINEDIQEVADLRVDNTWDEQLLAQFFPADIAQHIRAHANPDYIKTWTKGLPFKISFFLWRLWKGTIPTDDLWRRSGYMVVSKCWCCSQSQEEFFQHLFLTSETGTRVWKNFFQSAGLVVNLVQVAPALITWQLWKRRNTMKNGGAISCNRVIHEVNKTLHYLARVRYPWLSRIPLLWSDMIGFFEGYKPYVGTKTVTWQLPYEEWFKCNTDGVSRGNPRPSSYGFCVGGHAGDLVFAKAKEIGETTNIVAEENAIVEGLAYCTHTFQSFHELPIAAKKLIDMDKSQIPNLRIRIVKRTEPD